MPEVALRHRLMVLVVVTEAEEVVAMLVDMVGMKAAVVTEQKEAETVVEEAMEVTMVEVTVEGVDMVETMVEGMVEEAVVVVVEEVVVVEDMEVEVVAVVVAFKVEIVVAEVVVEVVVEVAEMEIGVALMKVVGTITLLEGMNVTNVVPHVLPVVMTAVAVVEVVDIIEEEVVEDMTITEEVGLRTMEVELMIIMVEGVITMMEEVEGAIGVARMAVIKAEKMVAMAKHLLLLLLLSRMVVLVETIHPPMVGMQIMEQMPFLHLQAILVDLIHILLHMGVTRVVMVEVMHGVVAGLRLKLDMTVVIAVDLVELLLSQLQRLR